MEVIKIILTFTPARNEAKLIKACSCKIIFQPTVMKILNWVFAEDKLDVLCCDSFNINSCQNVKILHASGKQEIWYYLLVSCAALRCWHSWQVVTTWQYLWLTCICYCQSFNCVKQEMLDILTQWNVWVTKLVTCCLFYVRINLDKCDKMTAWQADCVRRWLFAKMTVWRDDCVTRWLCDKMTVWQNDCVTRWLCDKTTVWQDNCIIRLLW